MAKIVVFSDLHAHTFKAYSFLHEDGVNSRLRHAIDCVDAVLAHAIKVEADLVLFGGDLFHERKHIVTQAFNEAFQVMGKFPAYGVPITMVHGNHDQADKAGRHHALKSFGIYANVIDEPGWHVVSGRENDYNLLAIPYIESYAHLVEVVQQKPKGLEVLPTIFLGHLGISGARLGADFVYTSDNELVPDQLPIGKVDVGFLGHFHVHQKVAENFFYVGAPLQHNWGDVGQERGFMEYDTETKVAKFIPLNVAPKFVMRKLEDGELVGAEPNNYVRVVSKKPWSENQVEETRGAIGAASLEVIGSKVDVNEAYEERLKIDPGASYEEMIAEYVKSGLVELEGVDEERLIQVAKQTLSEISS